MKSTQYLRPIARVALIGALLSGNLPVATAGDAREQPRIVVFDDRPEGGWSADAITTAATVHAGEAALALTLGDDAACKADASVRHGVAFRYLWAPEHGLTTRPFQRLEFWLNGGTAGGQHFAVSTRLAGDDWKGHSRLAVSDQFARYSDGGLGGVPAHAWVKISIPLADLGIAERDDLNGFSIEQVGAGRQPTLYIDEIALVGDTPERVDIAVDVGASVRRVDDRIFGICTYGVPTADNPADVAAAQDAGYRLQRAFYPTFNERPGMVPNPHRGLLFAERTGAEAMGCVDFADMEADHASMPSGRTFGTPQQAAALVAYANATVGGASARLAFGTDVYGRDWGTVDDWARLRAGEGDGRIGGRDYGAMRIAHPKPFHVVLWELDNEPWMHAKETDWLGYANFCKQANALMKQVDPTIRTGVTPVGVGGTPSHSQALNPRTHQPGDVAYYFLAGLDQSTSPGRFVPDFIVWHWYGATDTGPSVDLATLLHYQCQQFRWTTVAKQLRTELVDYFGSEDGAKPCFVVTENNMRSTFPLNRQMHALTSALYLADDLGSILQTRDDEFIGLTWHDWDDGDLHKGGYLPNPSMTGWRDEDGYNVYGWHGAEGARTRYPTHYAFKLLSRCFAARDDQVVAATSSSAMVSAYAVHQANGNLAILLINKLCKTAMPAFITLHGWRAGAAATWYQYGQVEERNEADISVSATTWQDGQAVMLPPYSLVLLSLTASAPAQLSAPASPTMVVATPGNGAVRLTWTAMSGAKRYDILRAKGDAAMAPYRRGVAATTAIDEAASNGVTWRYAVVGIGAGGASQPSAPVAAQPTTAPEAVTGLTATVADRQIALKWSPVSGATDYTVARSVDGGPLTVVTTHPYQRALDQSLSFTAYTDRGLVPGRRCQYRVSARNAGGESAAAEISGTAADAHLGPWSAVDLAGRDDGAMRRSDDEIVISGSGVAWYGAGEGRFLYQALDGDGSITARVAAVDGHGLYGKNLCGVMLRDAASTGKEVRWAMLGLTPADSHYGAALLSSTNGGGEFESEQGVADADRHDAPCWVRLTRRGDTITSSLSHDGASWIDWRSVTLAGLPQVVLIGPVVNSMAYFACATGHFDHVAIGGHLAPRP